jgi:hypothetical protein
MALALGTGGVVLVVLLWELMRPSLARARVTAQRMWSQRGETQGAGGYDPGRERRAEQRARALLQSCVEERDWEMYRDLGFLRVWGAPGVPGRDSGEGIGSRAGEHAYAFLIYPHKPIVAYVPETGELLNEYCVAFPDHSKPYGSSRLPHSDDVLAKWMALTADERHLIGEANMHLPGRQIDPERVRRDLARLALWESQRERGAKFAPRAKPKVARQGDVRAA